MTEHEVANSAKFAEIRARAEMVQAYLDGRERVVTASSLYTVKAEVIFGLARDVLALVEVAEAAQALTEQVAMYARARLDEWELPLEKWEP